MGVIDIYIDGNICVRAHKCINAIGKYHDNRKIIYVITFLVDYKREQKYLTKGDGVDFLVFVCFLLHILLNNFFGFFMSFVNGFI